MMRQLRTNNTAWSIVYLMIFVFGLAEVALAAIDSSANRQANSVISSEIDALSEINPEIAEQMAIRRQKNDLHALSQQYSGLITDSQRRVSSGEYLGAKESLQNALAIAQQIQDPKKIATALAALGNVHIALGPPHIAEDLLSKAERMSREQSYADLTASILINLGNFYAFQGDYPKAVRALKESIRLSKQPGHTSMTAQAQTNLARVAVYAARFKEAHALLKDAEETTRLLEDAPDKFYMLVNQAKSYMRIQADSAEKTNHNLAAHHLLIQADAAFRRLNNTQGLSYTQGFLGELYESTGRYEEALALTQRAVFKAQQIPSRHLLYRWLWQKGRVFVALKQVDAALAAYRDAISLLSTLRYQMAVAYEAPGTSFRESVLPAYAQFIELLLSQAENAQNDKLRKTLLVEVRDTVEQLKVAEIRDYFRNECVDALQAKRQPLWKASSSALIVYPILLTNRIELLLDFPDGSIKRRQIPVGLAELTAQVRELRKLLEKRTTNEYRIPAQNLYRWLISPLKQDIENNKIDTLVFVPDGPLLTIPLSALYDGEHHLVEQYAVAITPGIQLTDPQPLVPGELNPLLGGLSEAVEGFPALAHVQDELNEIQKLYGGKLLLNNDFQKQELEQSLRDGEWNVLHISTHGSFGQNIDDSFLLTYDGPLSIDGLANYVGTFKFRERPLELLVLSACETAQGDDRAALGLSGIAIRAGARSALGSLWKVNDRAASKLMQEFYRQIKHAKASRAGALQQAQLKLLGNRRYRHPGYWSAFLLINNWL